MLYVVQFVISIGISEGCFKFTKHLQNYKTGLPKIVKTSSLILKTDLPQTKVSFQISDKKSIVKSCLQLQQKVLAKYQSHVILRFI